MAANMILFFPYDAGESGSVVHAKGYFGCNAEKVQKAHLGHSVSQKCHCKTRTVQTWALVAALILIVSDLGWKASALAGLYVLVLSPRLKCTKGSEKVLSKSCKLSRKNTKSVLVYTYLTSIYLIFFLTSLTPLTFFTKYIGKRSGKLRSGNGRGNL